MQSPSSDHPSTGGRPSLAGLALIAALAAAPAASAAEPVAIELLLAVDSSSSIDRNEFDQQLPGWPRPFAAPWWARRSPTPAASPWP